MVNVNYHIVTLIGIAGGDINDDTQTTSVQSVAPPVMQTDARSSTCCVGRVYRVAGGMAAITANPIYTHHFAVRDIAELTPH